MDIVIWAVIALISAAIGFVVGRSSGRAGARAEGAGRVDARLREMAGAIARGRRPEGAEAGSAEAELQSAIEAGWAPREQERGRALQEAVGRVAAYLDHAVRAPLAAATASEGADELRERIGRALGALEDVDFFLREPGSEADGTDVPGLVKQVTREFAQDQGVGLRIRMDGSPARARVNGRAFMDALYLVLHNAARFGGHETVDVTVASEDARVVVRVRDRGPGFSKEAFARAFDPFYSTAEGGLGLGLPHARKALEAMGGRIELKNVPDGGAEVEVSLPQA